MPSRHNIEVCVRNKVMYVCISNVYDKWVDRNFKKRWNTGVKASLQCKKECNYYYLMKGSGKKESFEVGIKRTDSSGRTADLLSLVWICGG